MNRNVIVAGVVGLVVGFLASCGPEYGDCGRGATECSLEAATKQAKDTGKDVYVNVTVNDYNNNVVDVDVDQTQSQNQSTGGCTSCGTGGTSGAGGAQGAGGMMGTGGSTTDAGCAEKIKCKHVCVKYKVTCHGHKSCEQKEKVCKPESEW